MPGPLDGVRVLDFTRVLAGPHATRMLCDMGAEIIKVEPPAGDLTRFSYPRKHGMATYFAQQNVGKRNISIDLRQPAGVEIATELADRSDVLIENYRAGVLDRMGLGHEVLCARNPRLVYTSLSGYGATGPWTTRRAYAPVVGAEAGLTKSQGDARGGRYANDPHSHADVYTGMEGAAAILAALYQREQTGRGQWIDISMAETLLYVNEHVHDQLYDEDVDPSLIRSFGNGDYLVFGLADETQMIVSGHPAERGTFELFVAALGLDEIRDDPRFVDVAARLANFEDLRAAMLERARSIPDSDTFEAQFAAHKLASGVLRDAREIADTEWAAARNAIVSVSDRAGGSIRIPNSPWHFSDAEVGARGEPRYRGEDNADVLRDVLGYDDATIETLESDGVLSSRIPPPAG
ncbi:MAG: CaiB/BaiF CoA transferase family protein [Desertimonas sp.]